MEEHITESAQVPRGGRSSLSHMRPTRRSTPPLTSSSRPSSRQEKEKTRSTRGCAATPRRREMYTKKMLLFPATSQAWHHTLLTRSVATYLLV